MGVVKDGFISGVLPSVEAFVVHYPGYPSSMGRAIETLGGTEGVVKVRSSKSNKLELHFRPEDPYSHPAFGELHPCNNFLLKITKKKVSQGQVFEDPGRVSKCVSEDPIILDQKTCSQETAETAEQLSQPDSKLIAAMTEVQVQREDLQENLSVDIVAQVSEAYHFNGIIDYQHVIPVHADIARRKKRNWDEVEPQFEKGVLMGADQEDLMILVPPLFSLKDIPEKVVLKPSLNLSLKRKQKGVVQHRWEMHIEPSLAIDFNIKEIPKKVNWEKYVPQSSEQWEWQKVVSEFFDERPIWNKNSLTDRLLEKGFKFGESMLRRLLFRTAYYFSNGPFLRFWIRKGYDPRKDSKSRIYQRTDFRVPPPLRSYCDANVASGLRHRWKDICAFRVFPHKCQISLQLFDLVDDYIQQEIRKPSNQSTCSCATGWFSARELDTLRLRVAVRFLSVYPKADAGPLLKSASERFEKSKRMQFFTKDSKLDEEGKQVNKEETGNNEKEPSDEEEDDEDEVEDDIVEEDMDAYEELDVAGEDGNVSPQPYADQENISKNYLQELFGSFPFNGTGDGELQDADKSDGEYEIYEQDSDPNFTDEDDY